MAAVGVGADCAAAPPYFPIRQNHITCSNQYAAAGYVSMLGNDHNGQRSGAAGRSATAQQLITTRDEDRAGAGALLARLFVHIAVIPFANYKLLTNNCNLFRIKSV